MTVVVHQVAAARIIADRCARCGTEFETFYECQACGLDNFDLATQYEDPADHVNRRTLKARGCRL